MKVVKSSVNDIRIFEATQYVTGPLVGRIEDWPANIQDTIYAAVDRLSEREKLPLSLVHTSCQIDHGEAVDGSQDRYYVYAIASEVVLGDKSVEEVNQHIKQVVQNIASGKVH